MSIALVLGITASTGGYLLTKNNSSHSGTVLGAFATGASVKVTVKKVQIYPINTQSQVKRVSITTSIFNNSGSTLQISPGLQMQLIDTDGVGHPVTANYLPAKVGIGGPLKSSATWTQAIDFDLSANQTPKTFVYQPIGNVAPVSIAL